MNYLRSLTMRQWLIVFCVIAFFVISYFIFFNKKISVDQTAVDLEILMKQGTAPSSADEKLTKTEIEILLKQGTVTATASPGQTKNDLSKEQKDALLKLMSVPRK